jgi:hypothetical protein
MNRRKFIIGSSAAVVTAAVVGIPAAQPIFCGMDFGVGERVSLALWQRDVLLAIYEGDRAREMIEFIETFVCPFKTGVGK